MPARRSRTRQKQAGSQRHQTRATMQPAHNDASAQGRETRNDEPQCATTGLARKNGPGTRLAPDPFRAYATTRCPASHKYERQAAFTREVLEQPRPTVFFTK